jgi:hypothetical protein
MPKKLNLKETLSFGFEQTFTIDNWWTEPGFTATSDTPLKRQKMLELAQAIAAELKGTYKESLDIWNHIQYETFDNKGKPSFIVTMDPGSIEVKTQPVLIDGIINMMKPLFVAAQKANVVPYRNWWYGIKAGTEGGCHVNMGGLTPATNPLKKNPELVVKYAAYIHNRPYLHYPFMSIDVGPEGNAMRMDEKFGFDDVLAAFDNYSDIYASDEKLTALQTYKHFERTNLINNKSSFPSLYKFKGPDFLIEDRAQEAMRSAEEFYHVAYMRLKILEHLSKTDLPEDLFQFGEALHQENLTSYSLWADFQYWATDMDLNPIDFQCFFERQFPRLFMGQNVPLQFGIKEGRRPRVITDIKKRGDVVISKTVDTSYKRFELYFYRDENHTLDLKVKGKGIEYESKLMKNRGYLGFGNLGKAFYKYFDIKFEKDNPVLEITLIDKKSKKVLETGKFNVNDMQWV